MSLFASRHLRRIATSVMLVAMVGFVAQVAMITVSQAAASVGLMPQPAVTLAGMVHYHDHLAGHVHVHHGNDAAGHVHDAADPDEAVSAPLCCLTCLSATIPFLDHAITFEPASAFERLLHDRMDGIEPDGLNRPPSTPSIA